MSVPATWTAEKIEELRTLVTAGHPFSVIGARLNVSRNAAIGKSSRLGLDAVGPRLLSEEQRLQAAKRKAVANVIRRRHVRRAKREEETMNSITTQAPMFLGFLGIPLVDLRPFSGKASNQCRYIADEPAGPDYRCCGNETEPGRSYCPRCWKITHHIPAEQPMRRAA